MEVNMKIRTLLLLFITLQINTQVYACNYQLLDSNVEAYCGKMAAEVAITEERVRSDISFVDDDNQIPAKYKHIANFQTYVSPLTSTMTSPPEAFARFIQTCSAIFESLDDPLDKIGLLMLVERTIEKMNYYAFEATKTIKFNKARALKAAAKPVIILKRVSKN